MAEFHLTHLQPAAAFWAVAQNLTLHAPAAPVFPGAPLPQIPPISGKLLYAAVAVRRRNGPIALAGRVEAAGAKIDGVPFASLIATFSGDLATRRSMRCMPMVRGEISTARIVFDAAHHRARIVRRNTARFGAVSWRFRSARRVERAGCACDRSVAGHHSSAGRAVSGCRYSRRSDRACERHDGVCERCVAHL